MPLFIETNRNDSLYLYNGQVSVSISAKKLHVSNSELLLEEFSRLKHLQIHNQRIVFFTASMSIETNVPQGISTSTLEMVRVYWTY